MTPRRATIWKQSVLCACVRFGSNRYRYSFSLRRRNSSNTVPDNVVSRHLGISTRWIPTMARLDITYNNIRGQRSVIACTVIVSCELSTHTGRVELSAKIRPTLIVYFYNTSCTRARLCVASVYRFVGHQKGPNDLQIDHISLYVIHMYARLTFNEFPSCSNRGLKITSNSCPNNIRTTIFF